MKKILFILVLVFSFFAIRVSAFDEISKIEGNDFFNETLDEIKDGTFEFSPKGILLYIKNTFFEEIKVTNQLVSAVFVIALSAGILTFIKNDSKGVYDTAFFSCFCLMTIAVAKVISVALGYVTSCVGEMSDFVTKLFPVLSILLVSGGYTASATAFYPVFSFSVWLIGLIIDSFIIPLIYIGCICGIVNNMSDKAGLESFNKLIKSMSKWTLTIILTIFTGINAIYGFSAPTLDTVTVKTAKFAIGNMVPVVGGFLSDSMDTVIATSHLIKNAAGTAGIITLLVMCSIPVIKTCAIVLILKIAAALIEPVSDKRFSSVINEASSAISSMLGVILVVSLIFILSIAIVISSTNVIQ